MSEPWRIYKLTSPAGVEFFAAVIPDKPLISTRKGKWEVDDLLSLADLLAPQYELGNWDVAQVEVKDAPSLEGWL